MKTATSLPRNITYIVTYHKHCLNTKVSWKLIILLFFKAFCHNWWSQKTKRTARCSLSIVIVLRMTVIIDNCTNTASSVGYTTINYFISRSIMSDFFNNKSEPMDIEGEAECAAAFQGVTVGGEQGPAVDENVSLVEKQADSLLLSDEGEPTDEQEQVIAEAQWVQVGWGLRETSRCLDRTERGFS